MSTDPLARLDDYVRGARHDDDDAYEEDLFARALDGDAKELTAHDSLVATMHVLASRGTLPNLVVPAEAERLLGRYGDRAAFVETTGTETQEVRLSPTAELFIVKIPLPLGEVDRVDIESEVPGVGLIKTMPDVVFEQGADGLYLCCEGTLARKIVGFPVISRYWGHRGGEKRLLSETRTTARIADV